MAYRTFVDSAGTDWQVWDIVPHLRERRSNESAERRVLDVAIQFPNRRHEARRLTETRRNILRGTYARGWLCFEARSEKRRLTPIPTDWTTCTDGCLERYLRGAERVQMTRYSGEDDVPFAAAG
jgi:hypothetical protein